MFVLQIRHTFRQEFTIHTNIATSIEHVCEIILGGSAKAIPTYQNNIVLHANVLCFINQTFQQKCTTHTNTKHKKKIYIQNNSSGNVRSRLDQQITMRFACQYSKKALFL